MPKLLLGVAAIVIATGLSLPTTPAGAGQYGGTYTQTCNNARAVGDNLIANCRVANGTMRRSKLKHVSRCVGDIFNQNGQRTCTQRRAYERWQDGSAAYSSAATAQPPAAPGYYRGYNALYGFGR